MRSRDGQLMLLLLLALSLGTGGVLWLHAGLEPERCDDEHSECERWARMGECGRNPSFMRAECPASCGTCHLRKVAPRPELLHIGSKSGASPLPSPNLDRTFEAMALKDGRTIEEGSVPSRSEVSGLRTIPQGHPLVNFCTGKDSGAPLRLPVSRVNDNYCDCADGQDEPTTPACSGLVPIRPFAQTVRSPASATAEGVGTAELRALLFHCPRFGPKSGLPPSRIDDGVCDCCDGSDEKGARTPCDDHCAAMQALSDKQVHAREQAIRIKLKYEAQVAASPHLLDEAGGPRLVSAAATALGALAGRCFTARDREYNYELCLFGKGATQRGNNGKGRHFSLGRKWEWTNLGTGDVRGMRSITGVMEGGDSCFGGISRSLTVHFECGEVEALGRILEPSTCAYSVTLSTPAACQ